MMMLFHSFTAWTEFNLHDLHGVPSWINERNTTIISSSPQVIVDKKCDLVLALTRHFLFFSPEQN